MVKIPGTGQGILVSKPLNTGRKQKREEMAYCIRRAMEGEGDRIIKIIGNIGMGIASTAKEATETMEVNNKPVRFMDLRLSLLDMLDFTGLPRPDGTHTETPLQDSFLKGENTVVFFDEWEFTRADRRIQEIMLDLIFQRRIHTNDPDSTIPETLVFMVLSTPK